jgi:hypothetical protein
MREGSPRNRVFSTKVSTRSFTPARFSGVRLSSLKKKKTPKHNLHLQQPSVMRDILSYPPEIAAWSRHSKEKGESSIL